jgi:hypothetical protein
MLLLAALPLAASISVSKAWARENLPVLEDGHQVWVIAPGLTARWAAEHLDLTRDMYFKEILGFAEGVSFTAKDVEERIRERREPIGGAGLDSLLRNLESLPEARGNGLIFCGLGEDPPTSSHCLWISARLREPHDLNFDDRWTGHILPEEMAWEIRFIGGISRDLRWDEVAELLALPRPRLEAFRNLPADLPEHPMARFKRVFMGDKLFTNAALYAMSSRPWTRVAIRLGLVEAYRGLLDAAESELDVEEPLALEMLEGFRESGSLIADRMDRILHSLWTEVPGEGVLCLVAGPVESPWVLARVKD